MDRNRNIIIELERLKGEQISNISQYNSAYRRQIIQSQQRMRLLKYKNDTQSQTQADTTYDVKSYNCDC